MADFRQLRETVFVTLACGIGIEQQVEQVLVENVGIAARPAFTILFFFSPYQSVHVDEARAGLTEGLRGLGAAEAVDGEAILPDAHGEWHEIAIRAHDPEAVDTSAIKQVHRVDGHLHVGGVLALGHVELLLRFYAIAVHQVDPPLEAGLAPVPVGAADVDLAEFRQDGEDRIDAGRARIVGIDEEGNVARFEVCHGIARCLAQARRSRTYSSGSNSPVSSLRT